MIFQGLQDRAVVGGPSGGARHGQPLQRALHSPEIGDLLLDELNLFSGFPLDRVARSSVPDPQSEQSLDLIQREAQLQIGRSEEHTSELQSRPHLVCRLLLEKKKKKKKMNDSFY